MKKLKRDKGFVLIQFIISISIASLLLIQLFTVFNKKRVFYKEIINNGLENYKIHSEYLGVRENGS